MDYKKRCEFLEKRIKRLNAIGLALTTENDTNKIFEMILEEARHITNADGRTLYMIDENGNLKFEIMITDSIGNYLTKIRNAILANHRMVDIPSSGIKKEITKILKDQGYILNYKLIDNKPINLIRIYV